MLFFVYLASDILFKVGIGFFVKIVHVSSVRFSSTVVVMVFFLCTECEMLYKLSSLLIELLYLQ